MPPLPGSFVLTVLGQVLSRLTINAVLRGGSVEPQVPMSLVADDGRPDLFLLPQPPGAFFGYVRAPEGRAGFRLVVLSPYKRPESDYWLTQCA
jgi:hypothetical protein